MPLGNVGEVEREPAEPKAFGDDGRGLPGGRCRRRASRGSARLDSSLTDVTTALTPSSPSRQRSSRACQVFVYASSVACFCVAWASSILAISAWYRSWISLSRWGKNVLDLPERGVFSLGDGLEQAGILGVGLLLGLGLPLLGLGVHLRGGRLGLL